MGSGMKKFTIRLIDGEVGHPVTFPEITIEAEDIIEKSYGHRKWKDGHEDIEGFKKRLIIKNLQKVEARGPVQNYDDYKTLYEALKEAIGHDVVVKYRVIDIYNPKSGWWTRGVQNPEVEVRKGHDKAKGRVFVV